MNALARFSMMSLGAVFASSPVFAQTQCAAKSGATAPTVVELYTSEGCDSCPPADRWLSKLVASPEASSAKQNVIALSFHVDYWDYIGWKDAFAKPAYAARHSALVKSSKASGVYTPQVFVNGRDERGWTIGNTPEAGNAGTPSKAAIHVNAVWAGDALSLNGTLKSADGKTAAGEGVRLRYALTENGLVTHVKAGENRGVTLKHDAVVRDHGYANAKSDGAFSAIVKPSAGTRRAQTQLYVIAENASGEALAAVTLRCE
jgi:hypothetical protein